MAIVGEAIIIVRTVSTGFDKQLKDSVKGVDKIGEDAGRRLSRSMKKGAGRGSIGDFFAKDSKTFKQLGREAEKVGKAFNSLQRVGYSVGTAIGVLGSSLSSLVVGVVSLGGAVLSATPALAALGGGLAALVAGGIAAKLALSGIGAAVGKLNKQKTAGGGGGGKDLSKELAKIAQRNAENLAAADKKLLKSKLELTKAQIAFNKALKEGAEEIQQLGFDAEDAAIAEKKAALELEAARETLARVQDLPPNSRARREAELAYEEADLNLRMAMDRNKDLQVEQDRLATEGVAGTNAVISATENLTGAEENYMDAVDGKAKAERDALQAIIDARESAAKSAAGADPLAGLTASQKVFAKFLSSLKPQLDSLKEAAASGFLPLLQTSIQQIVDKAFPTFKTGLNLVGKAMGTASKSVSDAIVNSENLAKLSKVFETSGGVIESLGKSIGSLWGSLLSILTAAEPLTKRFFGWIEKTTAGWDKMLSTKEADGSLQAFFKTAGDVAAQLGEIFGNTFGFIGNLVKANTGPGSGGQILLDYLKDVTAQWKANTDYTGDGPGSLREFFRDAAINVKAILGFLGPLTKEFIKLAGDPNTKKFWDTLAGAVPDIGKIFKNLNEGGPAMAELLVTLIKMTEIFTESGGVNAFFKTLNVAAKAMVALFNTAPMKAFLAVIAPLHGFLLAIGTLFMIGSKAVLYFGFVLKKLAFAFKVIMFYGRIIVYLMKAMWVSNPIGLVVLAIVALIAIFVTLYNKNKTFRDFVVRMWERIKAGAEMVWNWLKANWPILLAILTGPFGLAVLAVVRNWDRIKAGAQMVWDWIKENWPLILAILTGPIGLAVLAIVRNWDTIVEFVRGIPERIREIASRMWTAVTDFFSNMWQNLQKRWDDFLAYVRAIPGRLRAANAAIWSWIGDRFAAMRANLEGRWDAFIAYIRGIPGRIRAAASNMWDGLRSAFIATLNYIITRWNSFSLDLRLPDKIFGMSLGPLAGRGFTLQTPDIPTIKLAMGGIVRPTPGGTLATIGEAGRPERVEPLDAQGLSVRDRAIIKFLAGKQGAGTNLTFKVYPSEKMSEADLAAAISRQVGFMIRKGGV